MEKEIKSIWKKKNDTENQTGKPVREIHGIDTFDWSKTRSQKLYNQLERELQSMSEKENSNHMKQADELLSEFEEYARAKELIRVKFDTCDVDGNFSAMTPEGILFILPGENFRRAGIDLDKYKASKMLGVELDLYVEEVNREKKQIIMRQASQQSTKSILLREFKRALEKGKKPDVIGRIIEVHDTYALVDVLNAGVTGSIGANKWRKGYTRSLTALIRPDQFYHFTVNDIKKNPKNGKSLIYLSRRGIDEDMWDNLNFTDIDIDSAIVVECLDKPVDKNYFWGASDRLPGTELTCEYTDRFRKGSLEVMVGVRYVCKVKKIENGRGKDGGKRCIVVRPFRVFQEDAAKLAAVRSLRNQDLIDVKASSTKMKDVFLNEMTSGGENE